eukprot:CAMPEP_0202689572 /NCGR_PEP_ID=MMETSP1385-20130828/4791_1 /ASSEMBLY_ACC=CAM_ASM_000861 /TAXON_ID=933848 /ORGANISM="Elphidium margaritaceum" /LENGTH=841 /DNA_ID=CAMNT_0049344715 /DNA_START=5 /DNA_END=2530 /DNA_ORIENTATION=-
MSHENVIMFPLPKTYWMPHQGVTRCMSCDSEFAKSLFKNGKDNCRRCGRVICKPCLSKHKIEDVRVCKECYDLGDEDNANQEIIANLIAPDGTLLSPRSNAVQTKKLKYTHTESIAENSNAQSQKKSMMIAEAAAAVVHKKPTTSTAPPRVPPTSTLYLSANTLQKHDRAHQRNGSSNNNNGHHNHNHKPPSTMYLSAAARHRTHSAAVSIASTVALPNNLDAYINDPLPGSAPKPHIIAGLLKEEDEEFDAFDDESKSPDNNSSSNNNHTVIQHTRQSSASMGNIDASKHKKHNSHKSARPHAPPRKSVTVTKWLDDAQFDVDEKMMKLLEDKSYTQCKIASDEAMVLRLDGFDFGNFTSEMEKPFDRRFHTALVNTACDICKQFEPHTVFVQSDELVLIYPSTHHKRKTHYLFGGKVAKIVSVAASFAAVRLQHHLRKQRWDDTQLLLQNDDRNGGEYRVTNGCCMFNAKCFNIGDEHIFSYAIWRLKRNVRGYKKVLTVGDEFSHGTLVKKERYVHPRKQKQRERITTCCVQIESTAQRYKALLLDKYWSQSFLDKNMQQQQQQAPPLQQPQPQPPQQQQKRKTLDDEQISPDMYSTMLIHHEHGQVDNEEKADTVIATTIQQRFTPRQSSFKVVPKYVNRNVAALPKRTSLPVSRMDFVDANHQQQQQQSSRFKFAIQPKTNKIQINVQQYTPNTNANANGNVNGPSPSRRYSKYASTSNQNALRPKPNLSGKSRSKSPQVSLKANSNEANQLIKSKSKSPRCRDEQTKQQQSVDMIETSASVGTSPVNPNYRYDFKIDIQQKVADANAPAGENQPMSAKERIKQLNARLQQLNTST